MFTEKKSQLFDVPAKTDTTGKSQHGMFGGNSFVLEGMKKSAETRSGNDALKYSTTGNPFVDQFGTIGKFKQRRSFAEISTDCQLLWSISPMLAVCFAFFIRMITRTVSLFDGVRTNTVQRGAGLKYEGIMRMIWLHVNHPDTFWKNIKLYISIASWKDIFLMLQHDLIYNGWNNRKLDWNKFGTLLLAGLENSHTTNLIKKYMPQIKPRSKCTTIESQANTIIGKWLSSLICGHTGKTENYKQYRQLKTAGTAHEWQKLISKKLMEQIDFSTIHGRALMLLVSSKFLANQHLEDKYTAWIMTQPIAKFTGYIHELTSRIAQNMKPYLVHTINKQFDTLIETAKKNAKTQSGLIVAVDVSSSMDLQAYGTKVPSWEIAKSFAIYFSEFLSGYFTNAFIEFSNKAIMKTWIGKTLVEKWLNHSRSYSGGTNFLAIPILFARLKNDNNIPESDFPTGILCISDGEFDKAQIGMTNVQTTLTILKNAGFSESYLRNFKIILWNIPNTFYGPDSGQKFETYGPAENIFYFSGYDPSILAFLTGTDVQTQEPKTAEEVFNAAMNQEIMHMIQI